MAEVIDDDDGKNVCSTCVFSAIEVDAEEKETGRFLCMREPPQLTAHPRRVRWVRPIVEGEDFCQHWSDYR